MSLPELKEPQRVSVAFRSLLFAFLVFGLVSHLAQR